MFTSGVFWGSLVVLWGLSIVLNAAFNLHIPFARIAFGLIVVYVGIRILAGGRGGWDACWGGTTTDRDAVFRRGVYRDAELRDHYSVVFGEGQVDLTRTELGRAGGRTAIHTVFGSTVVTVGAKQAVRVRASAAFGEARMPDGNTASFGEIAWESPTAKSASKVLEIRADVVFGRLEVAID